MSLLLSTGAFASSLSGAAPGMVLVSPTSITHSGTSATLGANGQVTFTAVTSLSLNGVFTADFDNYVISMRMKASSGNALFMRLRTSGSDASGSDYTRQALEVYGSTVAAGRAPGSFAQWAYCGTSADGAWFSFYGPYLSQPTAWRTVTVGSDSGAQINEFAITHSLSTAYDGVTLYPFTANMTGALQVYGVRS